MVCKQCGKEFKPTSRNQKYCGSYVKKSGCAYIHKKKYNVIFQTKKQKNNPHSPRRCFNAYRRNSLRKHRVFELTYDEFTNYYGTDCNYCGNISYGLDRIDSSVGYIKGNVVPCCSRCNYMKNTLDKDVWIDHMKKIILNLENK